MTWNTLKERHPIWFAPNARRFFQSRLLGAPAATPDDGSAYFVTSERCSYDHPRLYSVRVSRRDESGRWQIDTIGAGFQGYTSARAARTAMRQIMRGEDK